MTRRGQLLVWILACIGACLIVGLAAYIGGRAEQSRMCEHAKATHSTYLLQYYHC